MNNIRSKKNTKVHNNYISDDFNKKKLKNSYNKNGEDNINNNKISN